MAVASALVALALQLGGAERAVFKVPDRTQWHEYISAHFVVDTDLTQTRAQTLVATLEQTRALLLQAIAGEQVEIPGRLRVIALLDAAYFAEIAGPTVGGFFAEGRFMEPTVVFPVRPSGTWATATVAHELTHALSHYLFPIQPPWFSEGLAGFMQGIAGKGIGVLPEELRWARWGAFPLAAADLLRWKGDLHGGDVRYHLWGFVLFRWLWSTRTRQFNEYQRHLAIHADPESAWRFAFPEWDVDNAAAMARLERELQGFVIRDTPAYRVTAKSDPRFSVKVLSATDAHLLLMGVRRPNRSNRAADAGEAARIAEYADILAEDPNNAVAFALVHGIFADAMRAFVALRPDDWRAWVLLGKAGKATPAEREGALQKALQLNPDSSFTLNELAWLLVNSGRAAEALPFANRALDLAPWDSAVVDTLAKVAAELGKCTEALQLQRRAVRTSPRDRSLQDNLESIERRCAANPPASASQ